MVLTEKQSFLTTAAKYERISTLQADNTFSFLCLVNEKLIDILLLHGMICRGLADINILCVLRRPAKDAVICQAVIYNDIRSFQTFPSF